MGLQGTKVSIYPIPTLPQRLRFNIWFSVLGGSVARLLLQYPHEYNVRVVTRDPNSDAAKDLQGKGAEVVQADMTVPASLPQALADCWGVFGVTNFYDGITRSVVNS